MDRALRRWQQHVANVKYRKIVMSHYGWRYWAEPSRWRTPKMAHHWQRTRQLMTEPGHWIHEMMVRPARARTNQLLKLVENGRDPDGVNWPSDRKPHIYYW